jgi:uncharacterized protein YjbI with pentapeptide repeats
LIIEYSQDNGFDDHICKLLDRKAYDELFLYALNECNLFAAISVLKMLRKVDGFIPSDHIDFWELIKDIILEVPEKPDRKILENTDILPGTHRIDISQAPWVSDDGLKLAFFFYQYSKASKEKLSPHLKIISFSPYSIQNIPINDSNLFSRTEILFVDNDFAYVLSHETSKKSCYKYSLHDSSLAFCGAIETSVSSYYFDDNNYLLYYFDDKKLILVIMNVKTGECKETNAKIEDIAFIKKINGLSPLKKSGDFVFVSKEYQQKLKLDEIDWENTRLTDIEVDSHFFLDCNSVKYKIDTERLNKFKLSRMTFEDEFLSDILWKKIKILDAMIDGTKLGEMRLVGDKLSYKSFNKNHPGPITLADATINGKPLSESDLANYSLLDLEIGGEKLGDLCFENKEFAEKKLFEIKYSGKSLLRNNWKETALMDIRLNKKKLGDLRLLGDKLSDVLPNNTTFDDARVERKAAKIMFSIDGKLFSKSIDKEFALSSKGRFVFNETSAESFSTFDVITCNGELTEIQLLLDNTNSKKEIQTRVKNYLSSSSRKGNFVPIFSLGHKFPILASYWAKQSASINNHEIKFFSTVDYKCLFSYFAKNVVDAIALIYNDQFLFVKNGSIVNNIFLVSLNYIITGGKSLVTLDADDYLRIEPLLEIYPENKQLQFFIKTIEYFLKKEVI